MAGVASARVANRHALHSIYYSTTEKRTLPPNETCMRAQRDAALHHHAIEIEVGRAHE
jgi:hypothetical protein